MNRPVHFDLPVDDLGKAKEFYSGVFGWNFQEFGNTGYHLTMTGEGSGIDGGMMLRNPGQPVTLTIDVADLEAHMTMVVDAGGEIVVPRMPIQGVGWLCYFKDPSGNIFGMMQNDPSAG